MHKDIKLIKEYISRKSTYAIIPITWNEGEKIAKQIDRMQSIIDYADIIIADNASDDGSLADEFLQSKNIRAKVISSARGYGNALRPAISYALDQGYEGIITIDGNNKDGPEALIEMTEYLKQGYGFIQASRFMKDGTQKNMPLDRLLAVKLFMIPLFTIASGFAYTDPSNGFKAYSREFLLDTRVSPLREIFHDYRFQYFASTQAPRLGYKVIEVPASRVYPDQGKTPTKIRGIWARLTIMWQMLEAALGRYNV
ncbi:MAG: glycosyltransferase [Candidatus Melainabacteria bacterium]|jgi:dolichol-phosphate mannosyltransferase|nr:glycosyltransferase [Candidatus Melainabacteria bacterium]